MPVLSDVQESLAACEHLVGGSTPDDQNCAVTTVCYLCLGYSERRSFKGYTEKGEILQQIVACEAYEEIGTPGEATDLTVITDHRPIGIMQCAYKSAYYHVPWQIGGESIAEGDLDYEVEDVTRAWPDDPDDASSHFNECKTVRSHVRKKNRQVNERIHLQLHVVYVTADDLHVCPWLPPLLW